MTAKSTSCCDEDTAPLGDSRRGRHALSRSCHQLCTYLANKMQEKKKRWEEKERKEDKAQSRALPSCLQGFLPARNLVTAVTRLWQRLALRTALTFQSRPICIFALNMAMKLGISHFKMSCDKMSCDRNCTIINTSFL